MMKANYMVKYLILAACGMIGVFSRHFLNVLAGSLGIESPVTTVVINTLGSFLIGVIYILGNKGALSADLQLGLMVGLLGGFTTFSAFTLDTLSLLASGRYLPAILYVSGSVGCGLVGCLLGIGIAKAI